MVEGGGVTGLSLGFHGLVFVDGDGFGEGLAEIMPGANGRAVQLEAGPQLAIHLFRKLMKTAQVVVITAGHDNVINGLQHRLSFVRTAGHSNRTLQKSGRHFSSAANPPFEDDIIKNGLRSERGETWVARWAPKDRWPA